MSLQATETDVDLDRVGADGCPSAISFSGINRDSGVKGGAGGDVLCDGGEEGGEAGNATLPSRPFVVMHCDIFFGR